MWPNAFSSHIQPALTRALLFNLLVLPHQNAMDWCFIDSGHSSFLLQSLGKCKIQGDPGSGEGLSALCIVPSCCVVLGQS